MKVVRQADDPFVCFGAKLDKGFGLEISTWPEVGKGTRVGELDKGTQRSQLATGNAGWQLESTPDREETSRHEIESSSSEGRSVKMSQHSSWFEKFSLEIYASVSLQTHK